MGKVAAFVFGALWTSLGIWTLATGGDLIFGVGTILFGGALAIYGLIIARRQRVSNKESDQ